VLGVSGAQGSGKTTFTGQLASCLAERGFAVATLSLDDFYLTQVERAALARDKHPLFATRGVPGTHEVGRLRDTLADLRAGRGGSIPVFDKGLDDRLARRAWRVLPEGSYDFVLLEGWCVGVPAQPDGALDAPLNELEAAEDAEGTWRRAVNDALRREYRDLFAGLDALLLLLAPSFEVVYRWRAQQELNLKREAGGPAVMDERALERFIMHFERLTRHGLRVLPERADAVVELDSERRVTGFLVR
jgi:D-glycerate 3-kinase